MKEGIHPNYVDAKIACACGNVMNTRSTKGSSIAVDICSNCHPFYTGKQKTVDTAGRVEKFQKRYSAKAAPVVTEPVAAAPVAAKKAKKAVKTAKA